MGCKIERWCSASVFVLLTLWAQTAQTPATANTERLRTTLAGLRSAITDKRFPDELRPVAAQSYDWLAPRIAANDKPWKDEKTHKLMAGAPLPEAYLQSLELDLKVLQTALASADKKKREDLARGAILDLKLKSDDCEQFGRGRLVPVEVITRKGSQVVNDWLVYYRYVAVGDLPTSQLPMETPSSPARKSLPPGVYDFHAESAVGGNPVQSAVVRGVVSGVASLHLEIPVIH